MTMRMEQMADFLNVLDAFKTIERQTWTAGGTRRENDAEHTWHMCMYALLLHKELDHPVDLERTLKLILIHDLVEIYAGDTFAYDAAAKASQREREDRAAQQLFAQLPDDLQTEFAGLWAEFSQCETPEAQFAKDIDRMQAFAQNVQTRGQVWKANRISPEQIAGRNASWNQKNEAFREFFRHQWQKAERDGSFYREEE